MPDRADGSISAQPWDASVVDGLIEALSSLRAELTSLESHLRDRLQGIHPDHRAGAVNLLHYVGLRRHDLREIQGRLAELGLSSLGRSESHVLANLDQVLGLLHLLAGRRWIARSTEEPAGFRSSARLLEEHTRQLLGPKPPGREGRIMVTLSPETGCDSAVVRAMLTAGMNCVRVNCAHDDRGVWASMLASVERARRELGRSCPVLMDLGGPKVRTGKIEPGPAVLKWRPRRDAFGRVVAPARIFLSPVPVPCPSAADASLQVDGLWLNGLRPGDQVEFVDARGATRALKICETGISGCWAEAMQTAYLTPDTVLRRTQPNPLGGRGETRVEGIAGTDQFLTLHPGDTLVLTGEHVPGRPARIEPTGRVVCPASIPCTLPEVFKQVRAGDRVSLDDGRIDAIIRQVSQGEVHLEVTGAREGGEKLGADKGINFPDSVLNFPALTDKDLQDLEFVAARADLVGLSFVQKASDVELLQRELARLGRPDIGIVLKIETRRAFENLPDLLLAGMRSARAGVMIARGDLAVELGYQRMAEVQEEILWLAEAAHMPVIWATQVLESLAKRGHPSRAEISDAAMGERAECVMLNKGPHVLEAIRALDDILSRMEAHQHKKRSMLRRLHWWTDQSVQHPAKTTAPTS